MELIGKLDSPYVRRVAVTLNLLGLPYTHRDLSVFSDFDAFAAVNPVVKAPTLLTDDRVALMDSTLILDYVERLVPSERRLSPADPKVQAWALRIIGLALAACEKTVQIAYERRLRPADKRHQPWIDRVTGQLHAAYGLLETELGGADPWLFGPQPLQADVTTAIAWRFSQDVVADIVAAADYPTLAHFSAQAEQLPAFISAPLH